MKKKLAKFIIAVHSLLLVGWASATFANDIQDMTIYFQQESLENVLYGRNGIKQLPNSDKSRVFYRDIEDIKIYEVFDELSKRYSHIFPYMILVEGSLLNKDDNLCTGVSSQLDGVDISKACKEHDHCYERITTESDFKVGLDKCHEIFFDDMRKLAIEKLGALPSDDFGELYVNFLRSSVIEGAQFRSFVSSHFKTASLYGLILKDYQTDRNFREIIDNSSIIDIDKVREQKNHFCEVLDKSPIAKEILHLKTTRKNTSLINDYSTLMREYDSYSTSVKKNSYEAAFSGNIDIDDIHSALGLVKVRTNIEGTKLNASEVLQEFGKSDVLYHDRDNLYSFYYNPCE